MPTARITVEVNSRKRNAYKAYAASQGRSLKSFVLEALEEKVVRDNAKNPNSKTLRAFKDSEECKNLATHNNLEDVFSELGI